MRRIGIGLSALIVLVSLGGPAMAEQPSAEGGWLRTATGLDPGSLAAPLRALAIVTVLGVVPSIVLLTTCFPRVVIVLSFLRRALGTQELPPNMVVMGLSLLLTGAVMMPVWRQVYQRAYLPLVETKSVSLDEAVKLAEAPVKRFMLAHTLRNDRESLRMFVQISRAGGSDSSASSAQRLEDLSFFVVLPAFVLSELKIAFQMGFLLYLPFLLIDLVVSAVLVSMGMFMLPPGLVSLPLKVLVFVLVDGWGLVVAQLAASLQSFG
ncbi:MAG: flagellar type III secretion system pore protein FliP [Planctomycetes bacterium]|nr:flagellar type III secretion system pore protein FliP [Planctomycetota bacterium]